MMAPFAVRQLAPLKRVKPPFELPRFDLEQHGHRLFHKDSRSVGMRSMIAILFNETQDEWRDIGL